MFNPKITAGWDYHNATKHSLQSINANQHMLEWENQPRPYKLFQNLQELSLPEDFPQSTLSAMKVLTNHTNPGNESLIPNIATLATILHFSSGITKTIRTGAGSMAFRAAACTGALYHIELYLVCGDLPGLRAGVYHFGVHDNALRTIRQGDFRAYLTKATGDHFSIKEAPATIIYTSTFWRNAWKYQSRAYRHCFWDSGTILANTVAISSAHGVPHNIITGFIDSDVNNLLALDADREVALALTPIGRITSPKVPPSPPVHPINLEIVPPSSTEVDYQSIREIHAASSLATKSEVSRWREPSSISSPHITGTLIPLRPFALDTFPPEPIETVIRRRGSTRQFARIPISYKEFSSVLSTTIRPIPHDFQNMDALALCKPFLIVNDVEGLQSGTYRFHAERGSIELLRPGDFRRQAGFLDLGQSLAADAAVNVYFMVDLKQIMAHYGARGYRIAQLESSILAGHLYLASYALGLGATGLTFFDDDVTEFFTPHTDGYSPMFLLAFGHKAPRS